MQISLPEFTLDLNPTRTPQKGPWMIPLLNHLHARAQCFEPQVEHLLTAHKLQSHSCSDQFGSNFKQHSKKAGIYVARLHCCQKLWNVTNSQHSWMPKGWSCIDILRLNYFEAIQSITHLSPQHMRDLNLTSICAWTLSCVAFTECTACNARQLVWWSKNKIK